MIRKVKEGYRVVSESGRNMGTYKTEEDVKKRLRQKVSLLKSLGVKMSFSISPKGYKALRVVGVLTAVIGFMLI